MTVDESERSNERERQALGDKLALELLRPVAEWHRPVVAQSEPIPAPLPATTKRARRADYAGAPLVLAITKDRRSGVVASGKHARTRSELAHFDPETARVRAAEGP